MNVPTSITLLVHISQYQCLQQGTEGDVENDFLSQIAPDILFVLENAPFHRREGAIVDAAEVSPEKAPFRAGERT